MLTEKQKQGKKNRSSGASFERKVRSDLETKGWIVSKWQNTVSDYPKQNINLPPEEREDRKLVPAKRKYNPFNKALSIGTGFPDFVCFRLFDKNKMNFSIKGNKDKDTEAYWGSYAVIGVECKSGKYLDREEKQKCRWLLDNNIFSRILIAYKSKIGKIEYLDFEEYGDKK